MQITLYILSVFGVVFLLFLSYIVVNDLTNNYKEIKNLRLWNDVHRESFNYLRDERNNLSNEVRLIKGRLDKLEEKTK